jgi:hypothetical protein
MRPSRRVAILFVTTFLSTRHLLAQSEQQQQYRQLPSSPNRVEGTLTGQERAGVDSGSRQSRSITTQKKDCPTGTPVLLEPGDSNGSVLVSNPIHLRWLPVPNTDHYHLSYSVNGKKPISINTVQTEYVVTLVPGSVVTWSLHAHGDGDSDGGDNCKGPESAEKSFTVAPNCTAPSITQQPAGKTIDEGTSTTLTVAASGSSLSYQWYRGNTAVGTNSISFSTGPLTQTSTFRVVVTNSCGTVTSNDATVTVTKACTKPAIGTQPANATITSGSSTTLTVVATGTQPFTYQWYEGAPGVRTKPAGTSSDRFSTGALTHTTQYWVEVRNSCGTVASNGATVTVTEACAPPAIGTQPVNVSIASGSSATLSVAATGTQPFTYQWYEGTAGQRTTPIGTNSDKLNTGFLTATMRYWVEVRNSCGAAASNVVVVTVEPPTGNCGQLGGAPRASAVGSASSGVAYAVRWSGVANATAYDVQESATPSFEGAATVRTTAPAATYRHEVTTAQAFYYRVRAINDCDGSTSAFSAPVRVAVVPQQPSTATDLVAPHGSTETVLSRVTVNVDPSATAFTATASEPWITVTPSSGSVPPSGQLLLTLTADPRSLPNGTSTASVRVITSGNSGRGVATTGSTALNFPISISLVTPVAPAVPASGGEVLILPAVAHADGNNSKWQSDVRIAHTYDRAVRYLLTFTPSGAGLESALQTELSVDASQTVALDDILGHWFGAGLAASGSTGVLEIRTLDAAAGTGRTLVTSRLFNVAPNGSFGQFIAAVPLSKFLGAPSTAAQTLVALSQSDRFRTNVGLVEGSGNAAKVLLEVFGVNGGKLFDTTLDLKAGEYRQIGGLLAENGIDAANARINVTLASPSGSVFSYASVIDNETGDPSFVPPVQAESTHARRYTIAGVANLDTGSGKWQTDVRLFNGGAASASTTIDFFVQGQSAAAATRTVDVAPGQMLVLDDVVQSLFGMTGAGGALRITTATDTALVPAARTYHKHDTGTYGQFIQAATEENTVGLGGEPLHILQVEESARFRTNVGVAETEGAPATVEITASLPNHKVAAVTQFELQPNEFRQMNSLLRSMGLDDAYNASLTVRVIGGNGRAMAYGSVIDNQTQDPTYVMGY